MEEKNQQTPEFGQYKDAPGMVLIEDMPHSARHLLKRDLSLLEFFRRVLDEALDRSQQLLERLKSVCERGRARRGWTASYISRAMRLP